MSQKPMPPALSPYARGKLKSAALLRACGPQHLGVGFQRIGAAAPVLCAGGSRGNRNPLVLFFRGFKGAGSFPEKNAPLRPRLMSMGHHPPHSGSLIHASGSSPMVSPLE